MEKVLKLYTFVDGGTNDTPFPSSEDQIEIGAFRYDAKRMGGAPTITASVMYPTCLDDEWSDQVYAEFNGEKYYLKQTPTSSYSNEDERYKHDLELISERVILDNVYFYDAVVDESQGDDKPVSNSTKVVFFGSVYEFANRMNHSLAQSGLDYTVEVDGGIESEEKLISFEDQFFSNVLQEIYNTYNVPYYFSGKVIHIGYTDSVMPDTLAYGVDDALLSITKNNANYKIVNRATGTGSSENIPFYYPNNSPKGEIEAVSSNSGLSVTVLDNELFSNKIELDGIIIRSNIDYENLVVSHLGESIYSGETFSGQMGYGGIGKDFTVTFDANDIGDLSVTFASEVTKYVLKEVEIDDATFEVRYNVSLRTPAEDGYPYGKEVFTSGSLSSIQGLKVPVAKALDGYKLNIDVNYAATGKYAGKGGHITYNASYDFGSDSGWTYNGEPIELKDVGLKVEGNPVVGDTITQKLVKYIKTSQTLMPSIYRETDGAERFYNAVGDEYPNPYTEGHPKEHIITVEDIKPTIKEATNDVSWVETDEDGNQVTVFQRMDMFSEFAYDLDDNDELVQEEDGEEHEYVHSYFFAKLRKLDFNLFDHAIEGQPMTISFTSGPCGACNFEIGVTEEFPQLNPVQVNADGTLKRDELGRVICGQFEEISEDECQPEQQDTINNEVWIALKKEEETYGILMPKAPTGKDEEGNDIGGHRPKACTSENKNDGDTFVILGINLPQEYILNAEKKLEAEIIKYMKENNEEKFNFSIAFSRIYFEENPDVLQYLNENSRLIITYNGLPYTLYVNSFSYSMSEGDVLPQITVELDEALTISQNALQNAISEVKSEVGKALSNIDVLGLATPYFLRKDADDEAQGKINFKKGVKFGEGGKVEVLDNNSAKLTIEYLEVTKKATFTSLEIQEKTHVGGQMLITPAAINCGEVEEFDNYYRCYFQTKGEDGDEIFNQFAVNDQAICQTFNAWGSKYYWRLVVGIGEDYIDLSKTDCDEDSGIPSAGDKIIQMGNREDEARQNAIVIAAYGDGAPYIIQYKGINTYEVPESKAITMLSSTKNKFTGVVAMEAGSTGLEELQEFVDLKTLAGVANTNASNALTQAGNANNAANEAKQAVDNLEVGGQNLLRNSGFTGDYLSEQLADESVLESASELYSAPLDHWEATNASVQDSAESTSGKEVVITSGSLTQALVYSVLGGEEYVLSFKAKGATLTYSIGGVTKTVALTSAWTKYVEKITISSNDATFAITNATCTLCEVQLEKGNTATAWSNSPLDNSSDRAYYQSLKYLNQGIVEGTTVTQGGLVLSSTINLGEWAEDPETGKKEMTSVNAGMNGVFGGESAEEVPAFWAGGNITEAIATIAKYANDPTYQPADEELASMATYVVTHGGRAILNDIILRGYIYALGGKIGNLEVKDGGIYAKTTSGGKFSISDIGMTFTQADGSVVNLGTGCQEAIKIIGKDAGGQCYLDEDQYKIAAQINAADGYHAIHCLSGVYAGLRPNIREVTSNTALDVLDHTIIISGSGTITLTLPSDAGTGQVYKLINTGGATVNLALSSSFQAIVDIASSETVESFNKLGVVTLTYFDYLWYVEL